MRQEPAWLVTSTSAPSGEQLVAYYHHALGACPDRSARGSSGVSEPASQNTTTQRPCGPIRVVTEARLAQDAHGRYWANEPASGWVAWSDYAAALPGVELVARVRQQAEVPDGVPVGPIPVLAIPYYIGLRGLVRRAAGVARASARAVSTSALTVIRLTGALGHTAALTARLLGRPYVVEVIGEPVGVLRSGAAGGSGRWLARPAGWLMRRAVTGPAGAQYATEATLQSADATAASVRTVACSSIRLAEEDFVDRPRTLRAAGGRIIAIGSQDQLYKGHDDLIRAIALLRHSPTQPRLTLVGSGRYHDHLRRLARDLQVADLVSFAGQGNSRPEIRRLLDEADLYAQPSRTEGLPRALIEAMARGLPAIATSVRGIPELLPARCLVRPGRPAERAALAVAILTDPVQATAGSARNLDVARRHSAAALARQHAAWFELIRRESVRARPGRR
jgi:phosphatidylinositol alpha-1,6-mannosyltransferase